MKTRKAKYVYYTDVIRGFVDDPGRPAACLAWANWVEKWVDHGNRLDVVIDLHNIEADAGPQLFPYVYEPPRDGMRARMSQAMHKSVIAHLPGYHVAKGTNRVGTFRTRFGGWQRKFFGTHVMFYEVNSQAPGRHLSLYEVKALGVGILEGVATFLYNPRSAPLRRKIQRDRAARYDRWKRYRVLGTLDWADMNLFKKEQQCAVLPNVEKAFAKAYRHRPLKEFPRWIRPLFRKNGRSGPPRRLLVLHKY